MVLTDKQKQELHQSILEYFLSEGDVFAKTIAALREEANLHDVADSGKGLLEKKWTSVVRLQKKVLELEAKLSTVDDRGGRVRNGDVTDDARRLPRAPARSTLSGHRAPITHIAIHPVYSIFASASEDSTIKLWDYETATYDRTLKGHTGAITGVAFNAAGTILASCSVDMSAKLWDLSTYQCIKTLKGHDHTVSGLVFAPSGDTLLTCSRDTTIKSWEVSTGYALKTYSGHGDWVKCVALSADGSLIASGGLDHNVLVWNTASGAIQHTLRGHDHVVECVCFGVIKKAPVMTADKLLDPNYKPEETVVIASGSRDRSVRLWDAMQGSCLCVFAAHENWVRGVVFHPSGKYIISCSDDKSIRVLDIKDERCIKTIAEAHSHFVTSVALSPNANALVSASVDKSICIWECV